MNNKAANRHDPTTFINLYLSANKKMMTFNFKIKLIYESHTINHISVSPMKETRFKTLL